MFQLQYMISFPFLGFFVFFSIQYRNQYDSDVVTWSPQGRIYQLEYAMEAVKQGAATVGLHNRTHAVLVALKVSLLCYPYAYL